MTPPDLIRLFVVPLNDLGISYIVTGATAAIVYGEPRLTRDIDMVADFQPADAHRLSAAFPAPDFYVPPAEVIAAEVGRATHGHFNIVHVPTSLKADFYAAGTDPFHAWALEWRQVQQIDGITVQVAPPEYVIARKLQWFRDSGGSSRHLDDIRSMLRVSGDRINSATLKDWIGRLGLDREWRLVAAPSRA